MTLDAGDGLDQRLALVSGPVLEELVSPAAAAAALGSRQVQETLGGHPLCAVPGPLALATLAACVVLPIGWGRRLGREHPRAALLLAMVLFGALTNAGAVGLGGVVHARYRSRIAWLFPLAAGTAIAALRTGKSGPASR